VIAGRAVVGRAAALVWAVALVWVVAQLGSKPVTCNYFFLWFVPIYRLPGDFSRHAHLKKD